MPGPYRRDWHGFDNYRQVHDSQMLRLAAEGIVAEDGLSFTERTAGGVLVSASLTGRVLTSSGAVLAVEKQLAVRYVRGRPEVRTVEYAYHAWLPGPPRLDLFRYDNCHGGLDTLHRHRYAPDGRELDPRPVAHADLPWLSEVIEEAQRLGAASGGA